MARASGVGRREEQGGDRVVRGQRDQRCGRKSGLESDYEGPCVPCWRVQSAWVWFRLRIPGPVAGRMGVEGLSLSNLQGKHAGPVEEKMEQVGSGRKGRLGPFRLCFYQSPPGLPWEVLFLLASIYLQPSCL